MGFPSARPVPQGPRVLYLGGLGRSGTTLLERLLGELPGAVSLGEVVHLWERGVVAAERCGCGASFQECPFWIQVGEKAFGGWRSVDIERFRRLKAAVDRTRHLPALARRRLSARTHTLLSAYLEHYIRLYLAVQQVTGADVVVDSSKHAALAFCLRWAAHGAGTGELDLRVIHVVRDSRGVAYSWTKQVRRPEASGRQGAAQRSGESNGEFMARWSPVKAAVHWDVENIAFSLLARRGIATMRLRYEELLRTPAEALRASAEFAGLPAGDIPQVFRTEGDGTVSARLSANHTASGNPMRFRTGRIALRHDDAWRSHLAPADRRKVTALTLPLLRHYGYLAERS